MTPDSGTRIYRPADRMFIPARDFATLIASMGIGFQYYYEGRIVANPGDYAAVESSKFPADLHVPISGPIQAAVHQKPIGEIHLTIVPGTAPLSLPTVENGYSSLSRLAISAIFIYFFENHLPWIKNNFNGPSGEHWPSVLDFARVVRNACSHGGKLAFAKPTSRAVSWRGITYKPTDADKLVIVGDLSMADIIFLMMDVSDVLDRGGCPNPFMRNT